MTVLIAGAGIGGLTAALSFHQIGVPARVLESAREIRPLGVGINVLPHAVRELTELGLAEALDASGIRTRELGYYSKRGTLIWSEPRGLEAGYRWPQYSIHRGELQRILLEAVTDRLGPEAILTGQHLAGWEETAAGVRAHCVDRDTGAGSGSHEGALLIGADGIHSAVREHFYPGEGPPKWNGNILWRGISQGSPLLSGRSMIMAGHEATKFVCYPISREASERGEPLINWIAERRFPRHHGWRREDWNRRGRVDDFIHWFQDWTFPWLDVPALIRRTQAVFEFPMVDRDPLPRWTHGRITLLGDAAHPMYPIGSNGASQAILDARVLASEILAQGLGPRALQAYEAERRPATAKIVLLNRGNGPEQVMQLVEERAPHGFEVVTAVLSAHELEDIANTYKRVAGFDREHLNARPSLVPAPLPPEEPRG